MRTLLLFKQYHCQKCNAIQKEIDELKKDNMIIKSYYPLPENESIFKKYNIISAPVCVLLDEQNQEIERFYGFKTKEFIKEFYES